MAHGNVLVVRTQGRGPSGSGITLHQDEIGFAVLQNRAQTKQHLGRQVGEVLIGPHEVEIVIRADGKEPEHLVEHLSVLGRDTDAAGDCLLRCQCLNHRRHLDRLGASADHRQNPRMHGYFRAESCHSLFLYSIQSAFARIP